IPFLCVATSQAARNQVRSGRWLPCSAVPAVTETRPLACRALERQPLAAQLPGLVVAAGRAAEPARPALPEQPAGAGRVVGEPRLELGQRPRQLDHPVPLPRARTQPIARQEPEG